MIRAFFVLLPFISFMVFPVPLSLAALVLAAAVSPVAACAAGVFADLMYFAPHAAPVPLYTLLGIGVAGAALLIRRFIQTSVMLPG